MLSFFPRDVLDEILNFIESVSEGFPTYPWDIMYFLLVFLYTSHNGVLQEAKRIDSIVAPLPFEEGSFVSRLIYFKTHVLVT